MERKGNFLPNQILILRALQLGDLLCAVPAFRALRLALPKAKITLLGLPWAHSFVQRYNRYLDEFIEFPGYPGLPEQPVDVQKIPNFLVKIQDRGFDLAIQMQGSGSVVNPLVTIFGATRTAGYYLADQFCPNEDLFLIYSEHLSEINRHLVLMEKLGFPSQGEELEFPISLADQEEYEILLEKFGLQPGNYVCIHAGAKAPERRWAPESFAAVADWIAKKGFQIVLTGTEEERGLVEQVAGSMKFPSVNLGGQTSLGGFGFLLKEAFLLVCNDTGASHLADALKVPSVVLFSASEPHQWAPMDRTLHRIVETASKVSVDEVISVVDQAIYEVGIHVH